MGESRGRDFERLADPEPVDRDQFDTWLKGQGDDRSVERRELLAQLESFREAEAELEAERQRLAEQRAALATDLETIREARTRAIEDASLGDIVGALADDDAIQQARERITDALKLTPAVTEWKAVASELRTTSGYAAHVWRLLGQKPRALALFGIAVVFAVLAVVPPLLAQLDSWDWVGRLGSVVAAAGALGTMVRRYVQPASERAAAALQVVEESVQRADEVESRVRAEHDQRARVLEDQLRTSDVRLAELGGKLGRFDEQMEEVEGRIRDLGVGRQLYDFLSERAADYREQQGVIGMLHRDFRLLDATLRSPADSEHEPDAGGPTALKPIRRVVLYIDDLDRCPPDKVLHVLQAVHLLLALELFIVVVGVDPRWLNRSLRHEYRHLADAGLDDEDNGYMKLLPIQYLEKIFQIPLTLPRMEEQGYQQLITGLAPGVDTSQGPAAELRGADRPTPTPRPARDDLDGDDDLDDIRAALAGATEQSGVPETHEAPQRALLTSEEGSPAAGPGGRRIDLTPDELGFAQRLGGLVETPRAAKRLLNLYRLVRATQAVGSGSRFLGVNRSAGEFHAVQTLLAVGAGFPAETDDLLIALQRAGARGSDDGDDGPRRWSDFVAGLAPSAAGTDGALSTAATGVIEGDIVRWRELHAGLTDTLRYNPLDELAPYVEWGPRVARFSFTL